jgi:ectoine hydroxylase-related dioxygenase (phytanoyl-CoA dioxygenase family)
MILCATDQDGTTHWEAFGANAEHGFNFMAQLHGSTADNAVWALPRSHRWGHLDIPQLVAQHGERVPGALPMITSPGDVVICNRNALHCSYPNTSDRSRITLNFGFHKRSAVDAAGDALRLPGADTSTLRAAEIDRRCRAIPLVRHTPSSTSIY